MPALHFCCRQRNAFINLLVRKNSSVIVNAFWFKLFWTFTFPFQFRHASRNSSNCSNCKVSRKAKEFTNFCIAEFMQFDCVMSFVCNRYLKNMVASSSKKLARLFKSICYRSYRNQLTTNPLSQ